MLEIGEDVFSVHAPIAISVFQPRDAIARGPIFLVPAVSIRMHSAIGIDRRITPVDRAAVGILRRFSDPEAAFGIPIERDDFLDQRLGSDEAHVKFRIDIQLRRGVLRRGGTASRVGQRVEFFLRAKRVHVRSLAGPRDAAQQYRSVMGRLERRVFMARNADESPIRSRAALPGFLVGP